MKKLTIGYRLVYRQLFHLENDPKTKKEIKKCVDESIRSFFKKRKEETGKKPVSSRFSYLVLIPSEDIYDLDLTVEIYETKTKE